MLGQQGSITIITNIEQHHEKRQEEAKPAIRAAERSQGQSFIHELGGAVKFAQPFAKAAEQGGGTWSEERRESIFTIICDSPA